MRGQKGKKAPQVGAAGDRARSEQQRHQQCGQQAGDQGEQQIEAAIWTPTPDAQTVVPAQVTQVQGQVMGQLALAVGVLTPQEKEDAGSGADPLPGRNAEQRQKAPDQGHDEQARQGVLPVGLIQGAYSRHKKTALGGLGLTM